MVLLLCAGCDFSIDVRNYPVLDAAPPDPEECVDADEDGHFGNCPEATDCDDSDPLVSPDAPERCTGIDDDCDGRTDEGFRLGSTCVVEFEGCQARGTFACARGGAVECRRTRDDLCDGVDTDCDGALDEADHRTGSPCEAVGALGVCEQGTLICSAGVIVCGPGDPVAEQCNGLDDDCDGEIDEADGGGPLQIACRPDFSDVGECNPGTITCMRGAAPMLGPCVGFRGSQAEICDGLDNDCDAEVDEVAGGCECLVGERDFDCYSGPPGTAGIGICAVGGPRACQYNRDADAWVWTACGDVTPRVEACDGLDNDCDGAVDEALALGADCTVGLGACATGGRTECVDGAVACDAVATDGAPEACNGVDDDCDGRVDELPAEPCSEGVGECARDGVEVCDRVGNRLICNAIPAPPIEEACDGLDNDCDGRPDEGFGLGAACSAGIGVCVRSGLTICDGAGERVCDVRVGDPSAEVCDALDNDCDGATDEGFGVGDACVSPGECGAGVGECTGAHGARCSTAPGGSADQSVRERCDGLDNDCDGAVDEGC